MNLSAVILAAGEGTRMRSKLSKVLHPILGQAMIWYSMQAVGQVSDSKPVVVVGHGSDQVEQAIGGEARFVYQAQRLGTGHAVLQAAPILRGKSELVLVMSADMPLLTTETLQEMVSAQAVHNGPITMLTAVSESPRGFGRVLRDGHGNVREIVEEAQATAEQLAVRELNVGVYCFSAGWLWENLERIPLSPKGEYYLTDMVGIAVAQQLSVQALVVKNPAEIIGVNTRVHLAEAEHAMRMRINQRWMLEGVTLMDPASTYIEPTVTIGQDTVIAPNTHLQGQTRIGESCEIGPNTIIRNTSIGNSCAVFSSVLESAVLEDDVDVGPFAHLRKGAHLAQGAHMGNFGEVKNSYLGPGTKMGHFSYIGDAQIGSGVNIGAGTITCNYDGKQKHKTEIEDNVFVGSDTMLVAPVKLGKGARTGAGSVVTKNVPQDTLAVGVPARMIRKFEKRE